MRTSPSPSELEEIRPTLALVLKGLASQGQNVNVTKAVFKLVKNLIPPTEIRVIQRRKTFPLMSQM